MSRSLTQRPNAVYNAQHGKEMKSGNEDGKILKEDGRNRAIDTRRDSPPSLPLSVTTAMFVNKYQSKIPGCTSPEMQQHL